MIAASTLPHVGTLLIDIDRPREIRWVGTSISPGRNHMSPFFFPGEAALFYYGGGDMQGPSVSDLGDDARLHPLNNVNRYATWTADGRILAIQNKLILQGFQVLDAIPKVFLSEVGSDVPAQVRLSTFNQSIAEWNPAASRNGDYVAMETQQYIHDDTGDPCSYNFLQPCSTVNHMVVVQRGIPEVELDRFENGFFPVWSPVADKVAFCQGGMIKEYTVGVGVTDVPGTAGDVRWPTYSPDGTDIAYMSGGASNWHIRLTSGASVPTVAGADDSRPIWSPDGSAIIFIRTYGTGSEFVLWNVGDPAVVELTDLPDGTILSGAEVDNICGEFRPFIWNQNFGFYPDRPCFFGNPVWGEVPQ